jgi:hypothetical protein
MKDYETLQPAIWVAGQELNPIDDGRTGFTGFYRQKTAVIIPVRIVVSRYEVGQIEAEGAMTLLFNAATDALRNWTPDEADEAFVWRSAKDGPATENMLVADLVFSTIVRYERSAS